MKFEIMNLKESEEPIKEKVVRLGLITVYGVPYLVVLDEHNDLAPEGCLLRITSKGVFIKEGGVNPDFGFPLDGDGRITVT